MHCLVSDSSFPWERRSIEPRKSATRRHSMQPGRVALPAACAFPTHCPRIPRMCAVSHTHSWISSTPDALERERATASDSTHPRCVERAVETIPPPQVVPDAANESIAR